jgi:4-cresol dehydrogenase (hydroxylating)
LSSGPLDGLLTPFNPLTKESPVARVLPPGLSEKDFDTAIERFRDVVGEKYVRIEDGDLGRYRDPYPVGGEPPAGASAAVSPASSLAR